MQFEGPRRGRDGTPKMKLMRKRNEGKRHCELTSAPNKNRGHLNRLSSDSSKNRGGHSKRKEGKQRKQGHWIPRKSVGKNMDGDRSERKKTGESEPGRSRLATREKLVITKKRGGWGRGMRMGFPLRKIFIQKPELEDDEPQQANVMTARAALFQRGRGDAATTGSVSQNTSRL